MQINFQQKINKFDGRFVLTIYFVDIFKIFIYFIKKKL